jgi:hypothetical protein
MEKVSLIRFDQIEEWSQNEKGITFEYLEYVGLLQTSKPKTKTSSTPASEHML